MIENKPIIFAVVGESGCGKTTAVECASQITGVPILRSYTTRPMRPGERQGVEHIFVDESMVPNHYEMIAYTFFGHHHYWATRKQVDGLSVIMYVIDEVGLQELVGRFEKIYYIIPLYIKCDSKPWMSSIDDKNRVARDNQRQRLPMSYYYQVIDNNSSIEKFLLSFVRVIQGTIHHPASAIEWCRERAGILY